MQDVLIKNISETGATLVNYSYLADGTKLSSLLQCGRLLGDDVLETLEDGCRLCLVDHQVSHVSVFARSEDGAADFVDMYSAGL